MNRQRAKELLPIIEAFANGEEIEYFAQESWTTANDPLFFNNTEYRIKPIPRILWVNVRESELKDFSTFTFFSAFPSKLKALANRNIGETTIKFKEQPEDGQNN